MLKKLKVNFKLSRKLKEKLLQELAETDLKNPISGIDWGRWNSEKNDHYIVGGLYERDKLPMDDPIRIIEADGMEFVIIQDWLCQELDGKYLSIKNGQLIVSDIEDD